MAAKFPTVHSATVGHLESNLRSADEIPDAQVAAVRSLFYLDAFLGHLGIEGKALKRLRKALEDVCWGHECALFKPRRSSKPRHTPRQRIIQINSALLMQLRLDIADKEKPAAKAVEKILDKTGFRLSQGTKWQKATAETIINWRKGLTSKSADRWASDL
jgi:hypothetical protein